MTDPRKHPVIFDLLGITLVLGVVFVLYLLIQDWMRIEQTLAHAALIRQEIREQIQALESQTQKGPRHTACDTLEILSDWRAGTLKPRYAVEDRCQGNENPGASNPPP